MLFNSFEFLIFLPIVLCLYWIFSKKNLRNQNLLLLISSYVFYGWWDWRFLSLIFLSTVVDYFVGLKIYNNSDEGSKKFYLWVSILFNLGLLGFFKYFNFFIESWIDLIGILGFENQSIWTLNVILPVGISFYTFQTMSYSLDIYYGNLKPAKDFISFGSFVSFFPQLVAGPIERASNLLPQVMNVRVFNYEQWIQGLRLIMWGMFKKVVIADSLAPHVDTIYQNYASLNSGVLLLGLIYFSFQIYCDFSGYSDMAIGISKLFGFELISNFKFPFFSRDITELWKKWHISMSSWFRDYLYMPILLRLRSYQMFGLILSTFITYGIIGFWHGANYTFILFGIIQALLFLPAIISKRKPFKTQIFRSNNIKTTIIEGAMCIKTFFYFSFSLCVFRSETVMDSFHYISLIFLNTGQNENMHLSGLIYVFVILALDWSIKDNERDVYNSFFGALVLVLLFWVTVFHSFDGAQLNFIYFQF